MVRPLARILPALLALLPALAHAQDDGFKPLFNGKDLSGWVTPEDKSLFTVEDGQIVGRTGEKKLTKNEFLVTDKPYGDFILKAKVKFRNGNSGIQIRSKRAKDGAVSGPQCDVADNYWGLLYEERGRGFLDKTGIEKASKVVKKGDWNDFVIEAKGNHLVVHLNGEKVIDYTDDKLDKAGIIALQLHVWDTPMEVRFKEIAIKTLD